MSHKRTATSNSKNHLFPIRSEKVSMYLSSIIISSFLSARPVNFGIAPGHRCSSFSVTQSTITTHRGSQSTTIDYWSSQKMSSDGFLYLTIILCMLPDYNQQYKKTDRCPSGIIEWRKRESEFKCPVEKPYHCLLFYNSSQLYETCLATSPIAPKKAGCPRIYKIKDNDPVLVSTLSKCPVANTECPPSYHKGYLSNQLYMYPACFMNLSARIQMTSDTITEIHATGRMVATRCPNQVPKENNHLPIIIGLGIALCIAVIVIITIVVLLFRKCRVQESNRSTETLENNESIPGEGHGNMDDSAERLQLIPITRNGMSTLVVDENADPLHQEENEHSNQIDEDTAILSQGDEIDPEPTCHDDQSLNQHTVILYQRGDNGEDVVQIVFQSILEISDGVVSYLQLLMHFVQKEDCSDISTNLENILKGNRNMFRLLEDESICFVIAYLPEADICENYNPLSIAGQCVDPNCAKFHVCTFYVNSVCRKQHCTLPHTYEDAHNLKVKEILHLSNYTDNDINKILRNKYPKICITYDCDTIEDCPYLHICSKFCFGKCGHGLKCRSGHSFRTKHNAWILNAYGISEDKIWSGSSIARGLRIAKRT